MTAPAVTTTDTTQTAADAAVAASTTQTDANAQAWTPPANKEAFDKAISDAVTAEASKYKAPDKYDLKAPDKITVAPGLIERTAAIARELGLPQDKAQGVLNLVAQELVSHNASMEQAEEKARTPGTPEWDASTAYYKGLALADPLLGNGKPEVLDQKMAGVKKVVARFGTEDFAKRVEVDPITWHPDFLKFADNIANAMSEKGLVTQQGDKPGAGAPTLAERFYPHGPNLVEGDPRLSEN